MKPYIKTATTSALKWAFMFAAVFIIGPLFISLVGGTGINGEMMAQKVVTGIIWFFVIFVGLWFWGLFKKKDPTSLIFNNSTPTITVKPESTLRPETSFISVKADHFNSSCDDQDNIPQNIDLAFISKGNMFQGKAFCWGCKKVDEIKVLNYCNDSGKYYHTDCKEAINLEEKEDKPSRWWIAFHLWAGFCLKAYLDQSGLSNLFLGIFCGPDTSNALTCSIFAGLIALGAAASGYFLSRALIESIDDSAIPSKGKIIFKIILPIMYFGGAVLLSMATKLAMRYFV